jgi:hypothetical protein
MTKSFIFPSLGCLIFLTAASFQPRNSGPIFPGHGCIICVAIVSLPAALYLEKWKESSDRCSNGRARKEMTNHDEEASIVCRKRYIRSVTTTPEQDEQLPRSPTTQLPRFAGSFIPQCHCKHICVRQNCQANWQIMHIIMKMVPKGSCPTFQLMHVSFFLILVPRRT